MKTKRLLALGLSGFLALGSITACANQEGQTGETDAKSLAEEQQDGGKLESGSLGTSGTEPEDSGTADGTADGGLAESETPGSQETGSAEEEYHVTWEDMAEVKMVLIAPGAVPTGLAEVEAAINELTEPQINTHVTLEMLEMGNYIQQVSLKMSSAEQVDLLMSFPGGSATFSAMQSQGQLMDITELMEEYGQPVLDTVGDYIKATTVGGRIYGVPVYRNYASNINALMRTDVLEDLGLTEQAQNIETLADFEEILAAVKASDKWSYLSLLSPAAGNGSVGFFSGSFIGYDVAEDELNDPLGTEYVMVDASGETPTVKSVASTDGYKAMYEWLHDWYEKGYIYGDSATTTESAYDLIKSDKLFGTLINGELDIENVAESYCQMDMICVPIMELPVTTSTCTMFSWAVPESAKYPEAAVTLLSMLYTSPELNTLLAWGIEGRDYVVEDGIANYPDQNPDVPYHSADYMAGNQFIVIPWAGSEADFREKSLEATKNAPLSAYLGFTADTTAITNEISAINNVVAEFSKQINTGLAEPEVLDEYNAKLESSGIQKIIDEYQKQLDAWIESNK